MTTDERIELLPLQAGRRILAADLSSGWAAWLAFSTARSYAMGRLRHVGNTLRAPAATSAFEAWAHSSLIAKHEVR